MQFLELVDAAEHNDGEVEKVLNSSDVEIHPSCLNRALVAAIQKKKYKNAHHLLLKRGTSLSAIEQALVGVERGDADYANLILVKAAISNNCDVMNELYYPSQDTQPNDSLSQWGEVSLELPLKIALRRGNMAVWEKLMLMCGSEGSLRWSNFQLTQLDENLLRKMIDVRYLFADKNRFKTLPEAMVNLQQVRAHVDLQFRVRNAY